MTNAAEKSVLQALRELEIGESVTYPVKRISYLRSVCVSFGLEWGKKFATKINRAERTVSATRIA